MIYLDHNATTPVLPDVREAILPFLGELWGNPSSTYRFGSQLKSRVELAREQVADLIGARAPREIVFTSGGSESTNTAIHAVIHSTGAQHIITSEVEHSSVHSYCRFLENHRGYMITYLPVDADGRLSLSHLKEALSTSGTALVSLMWANNETGVIFPVEEIGALCHSKGVPFHCDAVQAAGKLPIKVKELPIDYLSLTGHKLGAPKGIGALYVNKNAPFIPFLHGGHQERSRRGGTENIASLMGLGTAAAIALSKLPKYDSTVRPLRDALEQGILSSLPNTELNGHPTQRLANTTNITFHGVESEALLLLLDQAGICASSGSACLADSPDPSHVIAAMKPGKAARQCVRFSLGLTTTAKEITETLAALQRCVAMLAGQR